MKRKSKKPRQPTQRERHRMLVDHNLPQLIKSIDKVRIYANRLDCALAECRTYADILVPHLSRSKGGDK